jgi:hypothetical protein
VFPKFQNFANLFTARSGRQRSPVADAAVESINVQIQFVSTWVGLTVSEGLVTVISEEPDLSVWFRSAVGDDTHLDLPSSGEAHANVPFVFGKIAADVGDAERAQDSSVRFAFEEEAEAFFEEALGIRFVGGEALDITRTNSDVVARGLRRRDLDFVNVWLLFCHTNGWLLEHAGTIGGRH